MPRQAVPMQISIPPEERDRLQAFARQIRQPVSWVVRDAVRVYMQTPEALAAAKAVARAAGPTRAKIRPASVGTTPHLKPGRPGKARTGGTS